MTADPLPAAAGVGELKHDLGVLFVHGIGEQKQAETLLACGEAIQEWLDQWLEGGLVRFGMRVNNDATRYSSGTTVERGGPLPWLPPAFASAVGPARERVESACVFERAALLPPLVGSAPAHAELTLSFETGFAAPPRRWLFAESWWGSQTVTPDISDFLAWLVTRGPWIVLLHLTQRMVAHSRPKWQQILLGAVTVLIWFIVSNVLVVVWIVVSLAAIIPIGRWRASVHDVLHKLAGVVGDSYDFVRAPMQRAAFIDATLTALAWLRPRCHRIVVMAHSQGVAVAHDALAHSSAPSVDRFISYGAGLTKLRAMQTVEAATPGRAICAGLAAPILAVALVWTIRLVQLQLDAASFYFSGPALLAVSGFICLWFAWKSVVVTLGSLRESSTTLSLRERQPGLVWRDYYATHDPVPNGPLSRSIRVPELSSRAITVLRSLWDDHTAYWQSRPGFVAAIVRELDRADGAGLITAEATSYLRTVRRADSTRVRWYGWIQTLHVSALLAVLYFGRYRLIAEGAGLRSWLDASPLSPIGKFLETIDRAVSWLATTILAMPALEPRSITNLLLCSAILYVIWQIWRTSYRAVWAWWRDLVLERLFLTGNTAASRLDNRFVDSGVLALGAMPFILAALWLLLPQALGEVGIHRAFGWVGAMTVTVVALLVLREALSGAIFSIGEAFRGSTTRTDIAKALGIALLCLIILALGFIGLVALWSITIVDALVGFAAGVIPVAIAITMISAIWPLMDDGRISPLRKWIALPLPMVGWAAAAWFGWRVLDLSHPWLAIPLGALGGLAGAFATWLILRPVIRAAEPTSGFAPQAPIAPFQAPLLPPAEPL